MGHGWLLVTITVLALGADTPQNASPDRSSAPIVSPSYDDFARLPADRKRERFFALTPEGRAMIYRTHAERWLASNRARLSGSEIAVFEEIVAFITPELYGRTLDRGLEERERALQARMRCRVSDEDVMAMMDVFEDTPVASPPRRTWTYLSQAKCWVEWAAESLVAYVPTPSP